ncbi:PREDICTED: selenoprotein S isoform X2 [Cyprinodon variegatus]|uniref:Selenoprotein S n=1 Tax=Cyprinodon variegatus TaxID=28743 RepID=A0A3Q2FNT0_CYPVA|nr:PREDICTED: selenoprotein S isoform X2 [Cyprinodon variegatus]
MDDDVVIEDVDDANIPQRIPLKNQDLGQLGFTAEFLSLYGWYLLAAAFTLILLIQQLKKRRSAQQEAVPHTLLDASLVTKRQEAMEAARQRMQEELDAKAAIFKEKQRQLEEEKRRQKIEEWESMTQGRSSKGHKLSEGSEEAGSSTTVPKPKTDRKPLRSNDYNPLMGQGGSCTFRPGRRGPSAGG